MCLILAVVQGKWSALWVIPVILLMSLFYPYGQDWWTRKKINKQLRILRQDASPGKRSNAAFLLAAMGVVRAADDLRALSGDEGVPEYLQRSAREALRRLEENPSGPYQSFPL